MTSTGGHGTPDPEDTRTESDAGGSAEAAPEAPAALTDLIRTLDTIGTGAYVADEQGSILAVNAYGARVLRRAAPQMIGQDAHDLLHRSSTGERVPRAECRIRQSVYSGGAGHGAAVCFQRGDGRLLPITWLAVPFESFARPAFTLLFFHPAGEGKEPAGHPQDSGRLSELERLALLAETTTGLTSTLDVDEALRRLVRLVLPRLADWAVIDLIGERNEIRRFAVHHVEDGLLSRREDMEGPLSVLPWESPLPLSRALRGAATTVTGPEVYQGPPDSAIAIEQRRLFATGGIHSAVVTPIRGVRDVLGALTLGRAGQPEPFTGGDAALLEDIARRTGVALENARLYQRQRKVAETMQRHLLPNLPRVPGLTMTVRYLAAPDASQVGGDWYDAFTLMDGATALAVGDVVGHDVDAAAGMAQLRNMLRAYAWSQQEPPSVVVRWLDQAVMHLTEVSMATMVFGRLTRDDTGRWQLYWTNAGHPPPLLVTPDGKVRDLTGGHEIPLGVAPDQKRPDALEDLPPGATLLFYTDGLIESPSHSLDEGMDRLRQHAATLVHGPLETRIDELLARSRPPDNEDDVALLAVRLPDGTG
jgi:hypothetical protein